MTRRLLGLLIVANLIAGCSLTGHVFQGGVVDDPDRLLVDAVVELVHVNDPRIVALDLGPAGPGPGSTMMVDDGPVTIVSRPETCHALPDVRVERDPLGLKVTVWESDIDQPCPENRMLFIELHTAEDYDGMSYSQRRANR